MNSRKYALSRRNDCIVREQNTKSTCPMLSLDFCVNLNYNEWYRSDEAFELCPCFQESGLNSHPLRGIGLKWNAMNSRKYALSRRNDCIVREQDTKNTCPMLSLVFCVNLNQNKWYRSDEAFELCPCFQEYGLNSRPPLRDIGVKGHSEKPKEKERKFNEVKC